VRDYPKTCVALLISSRKHTGERPFQCHCSRRFSRLDNLRQHAQTVHVNEEIPTDSLAATGTRFQRQVRTDRVRPPGNRSRASTAGSQTSQGRGHHRNSLSASSIGSIGSNYSQREDVRRRPPPLVMASDPRARLPHENYSTAPDSPSQYQTYRQQSPSGYSTPTSATFSTGQNSPRWGSGMQSPISSHSRTASLYAGHRTPGRRLSVPSGANPFQSPHGASFGPPPLTPQNASNSGLFSPTGSIMASPATSSSGFSWSRRDSSSSAADEAWRRRTWHPETYSNFTSRLVNVTTPNYYQSGPAPSNPQNTRLPGIESFDPLPRPATPPHRVPSPMMIDTPSRAPIQSGEQLSRPDDRRNVSQWDMGLHRNLTRLDLAQGTPPTDTASTWASEANRAVLAQAEQARAQPTVRFEQSSYAAREPTNTYQTHQHHISAPPLTPREEKRRGWHHGPIVVQQDARRQRTSPEDSSSSEGGVPGTPGSASVTDYNPSIVHSSGWVEPSQRPMHSNPYSTYPPGNADSSYSYNPGSRSMAHNPVHEEPKPDSMLRLEALVAVATSEENATTAY
jgi:C2H2 transcription facotor